MQDVERDLGTRLDWVAVDHWNTDNPPRPRPDPRAGPTMGRTWSSAVTISAEAFRDRAAERVTVELGPRSEHEIRTALEKEVEAERWTSLDRALRDVADDGGGVADLRPGGEEDP